MKTTYVKEFEAAKANLVAMGISMDDYKERDSAVEKLTRKFYEEVGLGVDGEFEKIELEADDWADGEKAKQVAKEVDGWCEWMGEEVEKIWKDGELKGTMVVSCRGGMYRAEMEVNGQSWEASNLSWDNWVKDRWNKAA